MSKSKSELRKIFQLLGRRIRDKYRLVILNENTFEEKLSFRLSRLNVFVAVGLLSIFLVVLTSYIIAFTSLREYIPGYTDVSIQRKIYELQIKADSMDYAAHANARYLESLKRVLGGDQPAIREEYKKTDSLQMAKYKSITDKPSKEDSTLRAEIEKQSRYNLYNTDADEPATYSYASTNRNLSFFVPLKGEITNKFNPLQKHFGIDVAANKNDAIKAIQDATVIFSGWTIEDGYVITLQHSGNVVSIYKNNSILLKKAGDFVRSGESIAIIGEPNKLSTVPNLHFELWINGNPVNPTDYIPF